MSAVLSKKAVLMLVIITAIYGRLARAEVITGSPIESYSITRVTVKKGDNLTFEVKLAPGSDARVRWVSGDLTLCETQLCSLATDRNTVGRYPIILTVTRGSESFVVDYEITVEPMPIGGRPRTVVLPLVRPGRDLLQVSSSMFVAKPTKGQGFRDKGDGLEAMERDWRPIMWREHLRTHPDSSILFGLPGHEHHILGEKTEVWLVQDAEVSRLEEGGQVTPQGSSGDTSELARDRLMILLDGTLRSRQLNNKTAKWTLLIPRARHARAVKPNAEAFSEPVETFTTWLQVQVDNHGDVLVMREKKKSNIRQLPPAAGSNFDERVSIVVIRGTARVTRTTCESDLEGCLNKSKSESLLLRAGSALTLETDEEKPWGEGDEPWLSTPDPQLFQRGFDETTPQYRPGHDPRSLGVAWVLRGQEMAKTPEIAMLNAEKALKAGDWLVAIEEIHPYAMTLGDSAHLVLGRAYAGLGLHAYAKKHLSLVAQFQRENPEPHLLLAHLALSNMRWKDAAKHLGAYDKLDGTDGPWISYYHGVVADRLGERRFARREMLSTQRKAGEDSARKAAQLFLDAIDQDTVLTSSLTTGIFYDSRVLRSKVDQERQSGSEALRVDRAGGGQFAVAFQLRGYQDPEAELKVEGLVDGKFFFDRRLQELNPFFTEIALRLALQPGGDGPSEPWLRAEMRPFLGSRVLGQMRALDEVGVDFGLKSPRFQHISLGMRTLLSKDPYPENDDLIEPSLRELVPQDDQSHHEVRYLAGIRLYETRSTRIGGELTHGEYRYDGAIRKFESFGLGEMRLYGDHGVMPFHDLRWDLSILRRTFARSEDKREDLDFNLAFSWSFNQTPLLSHIFGIGYEHQRSTRVSQDFARQTVQYQMRFDF
jgi:hypothetical protein